MDFSINKCGDVDYTAADVLRGLGFADDTSTGESISNVLSSTATEDEPDNTGQLGLIQSKAE